jgi:hypothetical protein
LFFLLPVLLFISCSQAGQLKLNYGRQNVCDVVEAAAMLCYDMAVSKGLALSWFVDPSLPPALMLDATRLQQILLNRQSRSHAVTQSRSAQPTVSRETAARSHFRLFIFSFSLRVHFVLNSLFCLSHSALQCDQVHKSGRRGVDGAPTRVRATVRHADRRLPQEGATAPAHHRAGEMCARGQTAVQRQEGSMRQ